MNNNKSFAFLFSLMILIIPFMIFAASSGPTIQNPLGAENTDVNVILQKILNLVSVVGGIIVAFFIIFSGFKIVMAKGKPDALKEAKEMFIATIIGGAILLGANVIANVVVNTVKTTTGAN